VMFGWGRARCFSIAVGERRGGRACAASAKPVLAAVASLTIF
jgi:hypothetical protein